VLSVFGVEVNTKRLGWFFAHELTSVPCDRDVVEVARWVSSNTNWKCGCLVDSLTVNGLGSQSVHLR